jgi:hypothetical protein
MQEEFFSGINAADVAASAGQARCLEVVLAYGHRTSYPKAMAAAAAGGYTECVTLLHERGNTHMAERILAKAAKRGHVACVQYIAPVLQAYVIATGPSARVLIRACRQPRRSIPCRTGVPGVCDAMAEQGNLIALQTLVLGGCAQYIDWKTLWAACVGRASKTAGYRPRPAPCFNTARIVLGSFQGFGNSKRYRVISNHLMSPCGWNV